MQIGQEEGERGRREGGREGRMGWRHLMVGEETKAQSMIRSGLQSW